MKDYRFASPVGDLTGSDLFAGCSQLRIQGIPATNRPPQWTEVHFFRISDGRIVEHGANFDQLGILVQVGAFPIAGGNNLKLTGGAA